jgi:hypothetical protein
MTQSGHDAHASLGKEPCANNGDPVGFHSLNIAPFLRRFGLSGLG